MRDLLCTLKNNILSFEKNATLHLERGVKVAGYRARIVSLSIGKDLKEFRKKSIEIEKNQ